jgi:hypothetical protein
MKAVWVTRSFLDYRVPVYHELCERLGGRFALIYNADYVPQRVRDKVQAVLGGRAIGLRGDSLLVLVVGHSPLMKTNLLRTGE